MNRKHFKKQSESIAEADLNQAVDDDPWRIKDFRPPPRGPKRGKMHFWVQALRDGTICFAAERRKPYTRKGEKGEYIDCDGCHGDWRLHVPIPAELSEANRIIYMTSIANKLNTKKVIREMVGKRLDRIEQQLADIKHLLVQRTGTPP